MSGGLEQALEEKVDSLKAESEKKQKPYSPLAAYEAEKKRLEDS